ncbi:DNA methylase-type I restriction-modification system [Candidatus Magnetobacterium bavaricum]|uniref:DNA methylase-type I restriction-modification system n=1 Tax=Candidatus Magnetobacterium bavaricum TaxID=29290 RepID=A0A0F3GJ16_9BACT|nr:DNA methylase-type I restriction-modification system [Candidatus Magnetobacterium bavaricum]
MIMQYSVVNYKTVRENSDFRIDAEYYHPAVLRRLNLLDNKHNDLLGNLVKFVVGPFGSTVTVDKYVDQSEYRYIRNKDINGFVIGDDAPALIPKSVYESLKQFHIQKNDLLITVVGTLGKVAIAQDKDTHSIFSCKSTLLRPEKINPYYLLTYLNSQTGQVFSLRGKRGAIQEGLNKSDLEEIRVFLASPEFQNQIEELVKKSFYLINKSKILYCQAEQLIISALGLSDLKPKHELTFVKNFSDIRNAERFDAEYFKPEYEKIIDAVKKYKDGFNELGNLVKIKKGVEPGSEVYQESGVPFVRVSNLSKFEISDNNQQFISEELYNELKIHQPKKGEILLSKDATPGIAYYLNEKTQKMIVSGGILRLKIDSQQVLPEYLTLVLNSAIIQKQIERETGGSIINHWRPDQVKTAIIPILKSDKQKEIKELIEKSFNYRRLSKSLLEISKRGIEMAIEKTEKEAEEWIKMSQTTGG